MRNCLNCSHLALWDDDWCCCASMSILSYIENGKTLDPKALKKKRDDCDDWYKEENKETINLYKKICESA